MNLMPGEYNIIEKIYLVINKNTYKSKEIVHDFTS